MANETDHTFSRLSARLWYICALCGRHRHYHANRGPGWAV